MADDAYAQRLQDEIMRLKGERDFMESRLAAAAETARGVYRENEELRARLAVSNDRPNN